MNELIQKLNELVASGTKKRQIEDSIGLPPNSLASVLTGKREMPAKWVAKIQEFLSQPIATPVAPPKMLVNESGSLELKPSDEALECMKKTLESLNKDYGDGTVMLLGEKPNVKVSVIPTGSLGLDIALGVGGFPKGRIVEIYGMESSGKTTIAISVIAQAQKMGGNCAFIDAEHAFDPDYADSLGVDIDKLFISQPDYGEQALEVADRLILSGAYSVIVIDSVAALVPKSELEGQMGDSKMGLHARLMSQALRKMTASIHKTNTTVIFINQLREKIGVVYGSPYVTTGGNALKFYASIRLEVSKSAGGKIMDGEEQLGTKTKVKVVKNKVSPPFKTAEFDIIFGKGIDNIGEIVDAAVYYNIIQKSGSWYSYKNDKLGQGREAVKQLISDNQELLSDISGQVTDKIFNAS